jgi:hypothetical protein
MYRNDHVVDLIELAQRATPYCPACGEHTEIVVLDDAIVLRCSTIGRPRTGLGRFFYGVIGPTHVSEPIVDLAFDFAA